MKLGEGRSIHKQRICLVIKYPVSNYSKLITNDLHAKDLISVYRDVRTGLGYILLYLPHVLAFIVRYTELTKINFGNSVTN